MALTWLGDARRVALLACSGVRGQRAAHVRAVSVRLEKHKAAKKMEMLIGNARVHPGLSTVGAGGRRSGTVGDAGRVWDSGRG